MRNLALDDKLLSTISFLAKRMKTTREDVVKMAVNSYAKKISKKNHLMQFAGILEDDEADEMLKTIYDNRHNKEMELQV
jgi:hypothetical protein